MTINLPWPFLAQTKLQPVGPVSPALFGLVHRTENQYHVQEPRRLAQVREALGALCYDPRIIQRPFKPAKHPTYFALTAIHRALTEDE